MSKAKLFWPLLLFLLLADCGTKRLAVDQLVAHDPQELLGGVLRFSLTYNTGAAFGIGMSSEPRWALVALSFLVLGILLLLYRVSGETDHTRVLALALVCGGATGNLIDRVRWSRGVVDFIEIGLGETGWWTFNIADVGITVGALLLVTSLRAARSAGSWKIDAAPRSRPQR